MSAESAELASTDLAFAILALDLCDGLAGAMALELRGDEEARLRAVVRDARRRSIEADTYAEARVPATRAAVEAELGGPFARYLDAFILDWMRHPAGDPQAFLWYHLVRRNRSARTPPALVARARAELAREELPAVPEIPRTPYDRELVAWLGFPVAPLPGGAMEASPMTWVKNRVEHVAFVRAWDKALARAADRADEIEAAYRWGLVEARELGVDAALVRPPGDWPRPPARPAD